MKLTTRGPKNSLAPKKLSALGGDLVYRDPESLKYKVVYFPRTLYSFSLLLSTNIRSIALVLVKL